LQGLHHGFGRFCGAVFGGMLIKEYGTVIVFRIYGVVCAVFLVLFILVNFSSRNEGGKSDGSDDVNVNYFMTKFVNPYNFISFHFISFHFISFHFIL
jgi:uncharacterized membrane protein